jgi:type I restriction enzyme S subunit
MMMATTARTLLLGDVIRFGNGKSIKPGGEGRYLVYGSNGVIGRSDEFRYENGIIIGRVGAYCGSVAYCPEKFWASDNTLVAFPASQDFDTKFLYFLLHNARLNSYAGGAAQPLVTQTVLKQVEVAVPPLPVQRRIAGILTAYDELIENCQRRIRLLEEMARALYREWFVHFRFPSHDKVPRVDSPLGPIPEGWAVTPLSSLVDFAKGRKPAETRRDALPGDVRLLLIDSLHGGVAVFTSPAKLVLAETRDTIMVMDGASSCEVTIGSSGAVGSTLGRFRTTRPKVFSPHALYRFLEAKAEEFKSKNIGAAIPHANKDYVLTQPIALPPEHVASRFNSQLEPLQRAIELLKSKIQNLRRTRDLLLPRLLSGQVSLDVSAVEDVAEPTAPAPPLSQTEEVRRI